MAWAKSLTLKRLASNPFTETRCSPKAWKSLWCSNLPPSLMGFYHLWEKFKVADRLSSWTKCSKCPICGQLETASHALSSCRFHVVIYDALEKGWAPPTIQGVTHSTRSLLREHSFSHRVGIMTWTPLAAHWSPRNSVLKGGLASFDAFLAIWMKSVGTLVAWDLVVYTDSSAEWVIGVGWVWGLGVLQCPRMGASFLSSPTLATDTEAC